MGPYGLSATRWVHTFRIRFAVQLTQHSRCPSELFLTPLISNNAHFHSGVRSISMKWTVTVSSFEHKYYNQIKIMFRIKLFRNEKQKKTEWFSLCDVCGACFWLSLFCHCCLIHNSIFQHSRIDATIIWKFMLGNSNVSHHQRPYVRICVSV